MNADSIPRASFPSFFRAMIPITLVAYGGPQAHIGMLHRRFVKTDQEQLDYYEMNGKPTPAIKEETFLELFALCQSLPGSGTAQFTAALGAIFGGLEGALATVSLWHCIGVVLMSIAGVVFHNVSSSGSANASVMISEFSQYTVGLVSAAFALVLIAANKIVRKAVGMDRLRTVICIITTAVAVTSPPHDASWVYAALLVSGGATMLVRSYFNELATNRNLEGYEQSSDEEESQEVWDCNIRPQTGILLLVIFFMLTTYAVFTNPSELVPKLFVIFWVAGSCTFGGGVVVIPLLLSQIVDSGILPSSTFLVGFGLFGCVPGPMFNLSSFLGGAIDGWRGAFIATVSMLSPGILVLLGIMPFWQRIRGIPQVRSFVKGALAVAAGLVLSGVYMLMRKALTGPAAYSLILSSCAGFIVFDSPSFLNIILHGIAGVLLKYFDIGSPFSK